MSDDEADPELLALLRESLGLGTPKPAPPSTGVLKDAEYICDNSIDVAISPAGTKAAAKSIWRMMKEKQYSTETWSEHELHPKVKDESTIDFIFTMNLLNFSFWSELPADERFGIEYKGKKWTGYWSLIAALQRALDEAEPMPLLTQRIALLREAGDTLALHFDSQVLTLIDEANHSAAQLVNLLVSHFPNFNDTATFHHKTVRLYKRAQIMVADLWACFDNNVPCSFNDIEQLTTFPDYRIPQMLQSLGVLLYSPRLESKIGRKEIIESGSVEEVELRGCSIWGVEMVRREIVKLQDAETQQIKADMPPDSVETVASDDQDMIEKSQNGMRKPNAVLIDFFLYDLAKEREKAGDESLPHHRTRSIYY